MTQETIIFASAALDAKLYPDGKENMSICATGYSPHYNQWEEKPPARLTSYAEGPTSLVSVTEVPVVLVASRKVIDAKKARSFSLTRQGSEPLTILVCFEPCLEGVDLLCAKDLSGYGRIIVKQGTRQELLVY